MGDSSSPGMRTHIDHADEIAATDDDVKRRNSAFKLASVLQGAGWDATFAEKPPQVHVKHNGEHLLTVHCDRRASDGGRLWFNSDDGTPICEADHVMDAVVWVNGQAAARTARIEDLGSL